MALKIAALIWYGYLYEAESEWIETSHREREVCLVLECLRSFTIGNPV